MVAGRLKFLQEAAIENVKQILDIGSWHLKQSIEFASIFDNAKINAFEPVPESFDLCIANLNAVDDKKKKRIKVHNIALSNEVGEIPFFPVDANQSSVPNIGASSMFRFVEGKNGTMFGQNLNQKEIKVRATTLDKWCEENKIKHIDIIWMDAQGSELLVLQGAKKMLNNTRIIMTEVGLQPYYQGHTLKADIDKLLFSYGFKELHSSFEINVPDYEANTIYVKR